MRELSKWSANTNHSGHDPHKKFAFKMSGREAFVHEHAKTRAVACRSGVAPYWESPIGNISASLAVNSRAAISDINISCGPDGETPRIARYLGVLDIWGVPIKLN